jgi:hypothetical protein
MLLQKLMYTQSPTAAKRYDNLDTWRAMITSDIKLTGCKSWEQQPISCDHLNGPTDHDPPRQTGNWKHPSK